MPRITPAAGAPCWFEFNSRDADRSIAFHRALFGWDVQSNDMGEYGQYHFLRNATGTIGALCAMPPGVDGVPSNWMIYFATRDLDASLAKAESLGGQALADPFDVPGFGRGVPMRDPTGAAFSLWQGASSDESDFTQFEDHSVGWIELATRDVGAAKDFYRALLDWSFNVSPIPDEGGGGDYHEISIAGTRHGGFMQMTKEWGELPSHWSVYFPVSDVDATLQRVAELGGSVCVPAFDAPGVGRIARFDDPSGGGAYVITLSR